MGSESATVVRKHRTKRSSAGPEVKAQGTRRIKTQRSGHGNNVGIGAMPREDSGTRLRGIGSSRRGAKTSKKR